MGFSDFQISHIYCKGNQVTNVLARQGELDKHIQFQLADDLFVPTRGAYQLHKASLPQIHIH